MKEIKFLLPLIELSNKSFHEGLELLKLDKEDFTLVEDFTISSGEYDNEVVHDFSCLCSYTDYLLDKEDESIIISYVINDKKLPKAKQLEDKMLLNGKWKYTM